MASITARSLAKLDSEALVALFREAAVGQARATEVLDTRTGNRRARLMIRVLDQLRARDAVRLLESLLADTEPYVRCCAAAEVLKVNPGVAEPVLVALQAGPPGEIRATAHFVLNIWRTGSATGTAKNER